MDKEVTSALHLQQITRRIIGKIRKSHKLRRALKAKAAALCPGKTFKKVVLYSTTRYGSVT
jgi:hypothetical protein